MSESLSQCFYNTDMRRDEWRGRMKEVGEELRTLAFSYGDMNHLDMSQSIRADGQWYTRRCVDHYVDLGEKYDDAE